MRLDRPALLAQLQPITPWRCGAGRPEESGGLVSSDTLFAALGNAMSRLGWAEEWLSEGASQVRLGSLFPAQQDVFYGPVPESLRAIGGLKRLRMESVRFAPLPAIATLAARKFEESRWVLDLASGCLLPADRGGSGGPFRILERRRSAVDRLTGAATGTVETEGLDFGGTGFLWSLVSFASVEAAPVWTPRLKAAFRLLADDGVGGWRTAGWGRSRRPRFREGTMARLLTHIGWDVSKSEGETAGWWTLGLLMPGDADRIQWESGAYRTIQTGGWSAGTAMRPVRFVREGSVLVSDEEPAGTIVTAGLESQRLRYGAGLTLPWQGEI